MSARTEVFLVTASRARGAPLYLTRTDAILGRGAHGADTFEFGGRLLATIPSYYGCGSARGPASPDCASTEVLAFAPEKSAFQRAFTLATAGPSQTAHYVARGGAAFIIVAENFNDQICFFEVLRTGQPAKRGCVDVPGAGAMAVAEAGDDIILVAASYHDNGWSTRSRVFIADARGVGAGALAIKETQQIPTRGAHDAELALLDGALYLFFAEDRDDASPRIESSVLVWVPAKRAFEPLQTIPTDGAHGGKFFVGPDGAAYLAIANFGDRHGQRYEARSEVWRKGRGDARFALFAGVDTHGATDVEHFVLAGRHFLAFANEGDIGKRLHQTSVVYEVSAGADAAVDARGENNLISTLKG